MSICLECEKVASVFAMSIAPMLLQRIGNRQGIGKQTSERNSCSHSASFIACAIAMYSDSVEERAIVFCLIVDQETSE